MKNGALIFFLSLFTLFTTAQTHWYNPMKAGFPVVQNQGFTEANKSSKISDTYSRLPIESKGKVRKEVWNLSQNSAGLAIYFYSNSPQITVRYGVKGAFGMPHMPSTGVSGVDLYSINSDGKWNICRGSYAFGDTTSFNFTTTKPAQYHKHGLEYRLYLPLYNTIDWLEIGVTEGSEMQFIQQSSEKPILLYGSSIAQGACASRPGMAWSNIMQRNLDYPLINLGFSGNGLLEKDVIDLINMNDARLYILDCIPNLAEQKQSDEIKKRVKDAVNQIRTKHDEPILLIEFAGFSNIEVDTMKYNTVDKSNGASREAYEELMAEKVKNIYYLSREELEISMDGWVDWVHPSDLGMAQQAKAVENKVREILHIPVGEYKTMQPVTQRREPDLYEWRERHSNFLKAVESKPKAIIIGNSITHYWSGEPEHPQKNGKLAWEKYMRPLGFQNLGCGWDRIENVLWRVYHGELDGYEAETAVLMIGTNNFGLNSDKEIVDGLQFLVKAIKQRQPKAKVKIVGIIPRRNGESWVKNINRSIKTMAELENCSFIDVSKGLLLPDGKIDETLFIGDGLHPNEKGYALIAPLITNITE